MLRPDVVLHLLRLILQLRTLTEKKYELQQEEEKSKMSPEEQREQLMAKIKRDNQESESISQQVKDNLAMHPSQLPLHDVCGLCMSIELETMKLCSRLCASSCSILACRSRICKIRTRSWMVASLPCQAMRANLHTTQLR